MADRLGLSTLGAQSQRRAPGTAARQLPGGGLRFQLATALPNLPVPETVPFPTALAAPSNSQLPSCTSPGPWLDTEVTLPSWSFITSVASCCVFRRIIPNVSRVLLLVASTVMLQVTLSWAVSFTF